MNLIGNRDIDMKFITSLALLLIASVGMAQSVPNTFTAGTPARAAEVNANFADVDSRIDGILTDGQALAGVVGQLFSAIQFSTEVASAEIVATAECPATAIVVSSSCFCEGDGNTRNIGILAACTVGPGAGSGTLVGGRALGGCLFEALTIDLALPDPIVNVSAMCMEATLVDGSPAPVSVIAPGGGGLQKPSAVDSDTFVINVQNKALAQRAALTAQQ